jgi:endonuclease YncB( thermonuclease family)
MTNVPWLWPNSTITRIKDGDSFVARVTRDIGFHGTLTFDVTLRLNRINTPPLKTVPGKEALNHFTDLVRNGPGIPSVPVLIETVKAYKFGDEWVAEVTLPDGRNVSDELVKAGVALYWDGKGERPGG